MSLQIQITETIEDELNIGKWFEKGGPGSGHYGHRGRKGKRGGSAPSKGIAAHKLSAPVGKYDESEKGAGKIWDWMEEHTETGYWRQATDEERANLKAQVARDLSDATGGAVTEQEAADFVRQWAYSSNDDDMRSLAVQQDAAKEFGVELSEFTRSKIEDLEIQRQYAPKPMGIPSVDTELSRYFPLMESDKQRALLRAMYNETQQELEARGITEVRLYRGMTIPMGDRSEWQARRGKTTPISTNAVESWSIGETIANTFAGSQQPGDIGITLEAVIPAGRILSVPSTGFGCLTEGEVVVLGGVDGDEATILGVYG